MKILLSLLLLAGCASGPSHDALRKTSLRLDFERGLCSGTAVGPHRLWTAKHCLSNGGKIVKVNGVPVTQVSVVELSRDRVSVLIRGQTFKHIAEIGPPPYQGQRVRFWGNPGGNANVYREGYIARAWTTEVVIVAPVCKGDSGSGIIDSRGRVVGVVSAMTSDTGCVFGLSF